MLNSQVLLWFEIDLTDDILRLKTEHKYETEEK